MPETPVDLVSELMATANARSTELAAVQNLASAAARELAAWRALGNDMLREIEELGGVKVSAMASDQLVIDAQKRISMALNSMRDRLRILVSAPVIPLPIASVPE